MCVTLSRFPIPLTFCSHWEEKSQVEWEGNRSRWRGKEIVEAGGEKKEEKKRNGNKSRRMRETVTQWQTSAQVPPSGSKHTKNSGKGGGDTGQSSRELEVEVTSDNGGNRIKGLFCFSFSLGEVISRFLALRPPSHSELTLFSRLEFLRSPCFFFSPSRSRDLEPPRWPISLIPHNRNVFVCTMYKICISRKKKEGRSKEKGESGRRM